MVEVVAPTVVCEVATIEAPCTLLREGEEEEEASPALLVIDEDTLAFLAPLPLFPVCCSSLTGVDFLFNGTVVDRLVVSETLSFLPSTSKSSVKW